MQNTLISYSFTGLLSSTQNIVRKALLGHSDTQKNGKYTYKKSGLLDTIPHQKIQRGVILVSRADAKPICSLFVKYQVKHEIYHISPMVKK